MPAPHNEMRAEMITRSTNNLLPASRSKFVIAMVDRESPLSLLQAVALDRWLNHPGFEVRRFTSEGLAKSFLDRTDRMEQGMVLVKHAHDRGADSAMNGIGFLASLERKLDFGIILPDGVSPIDGMAYVHAAHRKLDVFNPMHEHVSKFMSEIKPFLAHGDIKVMAQYVNMLHHRAFFPTVLEKPASAPTRGTSASERHGIALAWHQDRMKKPEA